MFTALSSRLRTAPETCDAARHIARCFATPDGQKLVEYLHRHVLFRVLDPNTTEAELRHYDGARQLVLHLCTVAANGRKPAFPSSNQTTATE